MDDENAGSRRPKHDLVVIDSRSGTNDRSTKGRRNILNGSGAGTCQDDAFP